MDDNVVVRRREIGGVLCAALIVLGYDGNAVAGEGAAAAPEDLPALYQRVRPAVVRIAADGSYGSGFVIADGTLIATAHHVVAGAEAVWIEAADGTERQATPVAWDRKADAALLLLDEPLGIEPLALSPDEPAVGDAVFAIGHPLVIGEGPRGRHEGLLEWSFTAGMVSVVGEQQIQTTVSLQPGNSGGPVFDDRGRVVGIAVERNGDFGLARKVDVLRALQDELSQSGAARRPPQVSLHLAPRLGMTAFPTAAEQRRAYGTLGAEIGVALDHRLLLAVRAQQGFLASRDEREAGRLGQHTELSFLAGPSFTLARARSTPVRFRLQPYGVVGVGIDATGTRTSTLEYTDPGCDPAAGPCPYREDTDTRWNREPYLLVGGGLRLEMATMFLDVGATLDPIDPAGSVGVGLTFGVRFGRP